MIESYILCIGIRFPNGIKNEKRAFAINIYNDMVINCIKEINSHYYIEEEQ